MRSAIERRSQARGDAPEVRAWLLNHFYRHVIGNLRGGDDVLLRLHTAADAARAFAPRPVPEWVLAKLAPPGAAPDGPSPRAGAADPAVANGGIWWVHPASDALLALEARLVEFLHSRAGTSLAGKLMRVTCPQALALWQAEHDAMARRTATGLHAHHPDAVRTVLRGAHGDFVELRPDSPHLRAEMAFESQAMRHCLGQFAERRALRGGYGEHYASACEAGRLRLFSLRSDAGLPRITISAHVQADGRLAIDQIKGKQNAAPVDKYRGDVLAFLNAFAAPASRDDPAGDARPSAGDAVPLDALNPLASPPPRPFTPPDALAMGLLCVGSAWQHVGDITAERDQLQVLQHHPALLAHMRPASALIQWLAAVHAPEALQAAQETQDGATQAPDATPPPRPAALPLPPALVATLAPPLR